MHTVFLRDFKSLEDVCKNFEIDSTELAGCFVILAYYTYECYDGIAFVLFERNGKLYEVHGRHCSCYGLEGQWQPEETTVEALMHRIEHGTYMDYYAGLKPILEQMSVAPAPESR